MDRNSALYWYPILKNLDLPIFIPATEIVPFDYSSSLKLLDITDEASIPKAEKTSKIPFTGLIIACETIGYPCFLRTDLASAKHEGPQAYKVDKPEDIRRVVYMTIEDNAMKDLWPAAFLVRKFRRLYSTFTAFRGHPIAREWRVFANEDGVICRHFYWPEDAIRFWNTPEPAHWREARAVLADFSKYTPDLDEAAAIAARALGGAWSIDFASEAITGFWWLIDAATAGMSWHPKDCPNHEQLAAVSSS